jgi:hypothetical protein
VLQAIGMDDGQQHDVMDAYMALVQSLVAPQPPSLGAPTTYTLRAAQDPGTNARLNAELNASMDRVWREATARLPASLLDMHGMQLQHIRCRACRASHLHAEVHTALTLPVPAGAYLAGGGALHRHLVQELWPQARPAPGEWKCEACSSCAPGDGVRTVLPARPAERLVLHVSNAPWLECGWHEVLGWPSTLSPPRTRDYELRALLLGSGSDLGAHYTAVVHHPPDGWFRCDNARVTPCIGGGGGGCGGRVVMAFYRSGVSDREFHWTAAP